MSLRFQEANLQKEGELKMILSQKHQRREKLMKNSKLPRKKETALLRNPVSQGR